MSRKRNNNYLISIDGSTTNTGISIFNINTKELIEYICISPENPYKQTSKMTKLEKKAIKKKNMDYRIEYMIIEISKYLNKYHPDCIIMEDTYGGKDMYAYKKLCHLQGLILSYSLNNHIQLYFKTPQEWRTILGIPLVENKIRLKRESLKQKSIDYIYSKYGIIVNDDIADSICLGLTYFIINEKK